MSQSASISTSDQANSHDAFPPLAPTLRRIAETMVPDVAHLGDDALRQALFPVTRRYAYLNHAAVSPSPLPVARTMIRFVEELSAHGSVTWDSFAAAQDNVRQRFAQMIGAPEGTIALTKNVSDAFMTVAEALHWQPGDNVVITELEFPSNVYPWLNLREQGVEVRFVSSRDGRILAEDVAANMDERTRLLSLSFVEFGTGFRNDLPTMARLAHDHGTLFCVDGIQGLGALQLDVQAYDIDFLGTGSPKWLLGPSHVGLLYVREELLAELRLARRGWLSVVTPFDFFDYKQPLRTGAARLEGGSNNITALVGLEAALTLLETADIADVERRVLALAQLVRAGLDTQGHEVISPDGPGERSGIVCFRPRLAVGQAFDATTLVDRLASECGAVVAARNGAVRISPHFYNTEDDITQFLHGLEQVLREDGIR